MKTRYKILIVCLGLSAFIIIGIYSGLVSGGSYPYAQQYEFHVSDTTLIEAVEGFKKDNPSFKVPGMLKLPDFKDDYRYNFYLYDTSRNNLIHCFIMTAGDSKMGSIYLDAVNSGLTLGNWKVVNQDYDRGDNIKIKLDFKEKFLNKLNLPYKDEGNGMFIFWK
jgi:hypothetical protein